MSDDIGTKLATLAVKIADEALKADVQLVDRLEAFRQLTTYYVNTTKIQAKQNPDEDEKGFLDGVRARIQA